MCVCGGGGSFNPFHYFFFQQRLCFWFCFILFCFGLFVCLFVFFNSVFCPINCAKRFSVIVFYIFYASFDAYEVKFWGVIWVGWRAASKIMVGGGWWNPIIFICPFHKYSTRHMLQTCVVGENYHCLHNKTKFVRKSDVSKMFSEKSIFANFHVYFQYIQICEGALTLWYHSDVI